MILLERRNRRLLAEIDELEAILCSAVIPSDLEPYRQRALSVCQQVKAKVALTLRYVAEGYSELVDDLLSETQLHSRFVRSLGSKDSVPVLRGTESDRLCLRIISWLHGSHPQTRYFPAAVADGACAVAPVGIIAPIYYFSTLERRGLLYQPLQFHEFGHVLYVCHWNEMNDLVAELQRRISRSLTPISRRNDRYAEDQLQFRQLIVNTWYRWIQEVFCDAVGFTIGGPCFLQAFSSYVSNLQPQDFYQSRASLASGAHPVTWLRVQLLSQRAADAGFRELAYRIDREWRTVARALRVEEDYHGFYDRRLEDRIVRCVEDMLIEADPRPYVEEEAVGSGQVTGSPLWLLNEAWRRFEADPQRYPLWEREAIAAFLA